MARRKFVSAATGLALTLGAAMTAIVVTAMPSWSATACSLYANKPTGSANGVGGRQGCSGTVTLTVRVRKNRTAQPDQTVGSASKTGFGNGSISVNGACSGSGSYHTDTTSSSGNSVRSGDAGLC
jgi:hypothetical protein